MKIQPQTGRADQANKQTLTAHIAKSWNIQLRRLRQWHTRHSKPIHQRSTPIFRSSTVETATQFHPAPKYTSSVVYPDTTHNSDTINAAVCRLSTTPGWLRRQFWLVEQPLFSLDSLQLPFRFICIISSACLVLGRMPKIVSCGRGGWWRDLQFRSRARNMEFL